MVSENIASEVCKKVKSAIKAKLTELGIYADDELPDYIMILIENKKTKDQMDDDLSLFLGHNTERFTSWLHNVLQKLDSAPFLQMKESKVSKENDKKKEEKEKPEVEVNKTSVTVAATEEKKKHKKKKAKSEKKKEKKEKKKKKDKEKHSKTQRHKEKDSSRSKSKSPSVEEDPSSSSSKIISEESSSNTVSSLKAPKRVVSESLLQVTNVSKLRTEIAKTSQEEDSDADGLVKEDEEVPEDVVNLRPNEEDLALGLEDDVPAKKQKSLSKDMKDQIISIKKPLQNIEVKVDSSGAKEVATKPIIELPEPDSGPVTSGSVTGVSVHDRLGAPPTSSVPPLSSSKRIINLREESSFPPKSSAPLHTGAEGMGRVVSSAIASAVKSVGMATAAKGIADGKTSKKLEARVRPLFNARRTEAEDGTQNDLPPPRVVSTVGVVLKRSHSSDDETEEPSSKRIGVVSKIEVSPRPRRVGAAQANTALILRAVADAHKSVNKPIRKTVGDEKEEEKGKKEIFTRSYQERQSQRLNSSNEAKGIKKFPITVPNALLKDNVEMQIEGKSVLGETHLEEFEIEEEYGPEVDTQTSAADGKSSQDKLLSQSKASGAGRLVPMQVDDPTGSTRFIVTLDGLSTEAGSASDLRSRLSGRPVRTPSVDEEEFIEEVEEWEEVEEMEGVTLQGVGQERVSSGVSAEGGGVFASKWKAKIDATGLAPKKEERCRYWPACKEGASCQFIHPSKLCNMFPGCRFGDKCIYIHPNCKFDSFCTKPNCPYTHAGSRTFAVAATKPKIAAPKSKIKCRYYPKCVDMACPFMHPKQICRYGKACQTPSCMFVHPDVTTGALLKWTASKQSAPNGTTTATPSSVSTTTPTLTSDALAAI